MNGSWGECCCKKKSLLCKNDNSKGWIVLSRPLNVETFTSLTTMIQTARLFSRKEENLIFCGAICAESRRVNLWGFYAAVLSTRTCCSLVSIWVYACSCSPRFLLKCSKVTPMKRTKTVCNAKKTEVSTLEYFSILLIGMALSKFSADCNRSTWHIVP